MNFNDSQLYMIKGGNPTGLVNIADGCASWVKSRNNLTFYIAKEVVEKSPYKFDTYLKFIKDLEFDISIIIEEEELKRINSLIASPSNQYFKISLLTTGYTKNVYYVYTIFRRFMYYTTYFENVLNKYLDYPDFDKLDKVDKFNLITKWDIPYVGNLLTNGYFCYQNFTNYDQSIFNKLNYLNISDLEFKTSQKVTKTLGLSNDMDIKVFRDLVEFKFIRVYYKEIYSDTYEVKIQDKTYLTTMHPDTYNNSFEPTTDFYVAYVDYSRTAVGETLLWYVKKGIVIKEGSPGYKKASIKRKIRSSSRRLFGKYMIYHEEKVQLATWEIVLQLSKNNFICAD